MHSWLSQNRYSSSMTPWPFPWLRVAIWILQALPVGGRVLPSPIGIGWVNVPSIAPITAVHSP